MTAQSPAPALLMSDVEYASGPEAMQSCDHGTVTNKRSVMLSMQCKRLHVMLHNKRKRTHLSAEPCLQDRNRSAAVNRAYHGDDDVSKVMYT